MKMGKNQWIGKNMLIPEKVLEHLDQEMEEAAEELEQMEK
jgi:predicted DNA-binding transcriptional regulator